MWVASYCATDRLWQGYCYVSEHSYALCLRILMLKLLHLLIFRGPLGPSSISGIDNAPIYEFIMKTKAPEGVLSTHVNVVGHKRALNRDRDNNESHYMKPNNRDNYTQLDQVEPAEPSMLQTMSCSHKLDYHARLLPNLSDLPQSYERVKGKAKELFMVNDICSHNWVLVCLCKV